MARSRTPTGRLLGPVKTALQLGPPSVLLKAPAVPVPAYTVEGALGSMARAPTTGARNPVLTMLQVSPPSVLLKTALLYVPAYRVAGAWGSIARAAIKINPGLVSPVGCQLPPPSVLLKTASVAPA